MSDTSDDLAALNLSLAALKKARGSGVLVVRHGDTSVTYRSMDDINKAIAGVLSEIKALGGTGRKPRYVVQHFKGL